MALINLGIISDLHLESWGKKALPTFLQTANQANADHIIIAGDLHPNSLVRSEFFDGLKKPYTFIQGNHDFYGSQIQSTFGEDDVAVKATLWTNFWDDGENGLRLIMCERGISDFTQITNEDSYNWRIRPEDMIKMFHEHLNYIKASSKQIVVTHFPMNLRSITAQFMGDVLNPYFVNDIPDEEIIAMNKKLLIHGHVHSLHDYKIGETRVVCNACGYRGEIHQVPDDYQVKIVAVEI